MGPTVVAVVVAAGRGLRAGGDLPKQYRKLAGEPVIRSCLSLFAWHGEIAAVQAVIHPDDRTSYDAAAAGLRLLPPVPGGTTRQASVRAGLEALSARAPDIVLVHDAARPFCSAELVSRAIVACAATGAAIPALEVTDTIKRVDAGGHVTGTLDRAQLRVRAPSVCVPALLGASRAARKAASFTDDAALAEWAGLNVAVFAGKAGT
jgi:2-C-methyl-D-erythritol 4-phosphate cytidylyltransferase/2-C-methyl-D-erythritol 2,4-cyclodiphosphate synthase